MNTTLPQTILEFLSQLRDALRDADPALVQDAVYDAEEYLRAECTAHPDQSESEVIARVAGTYGTPVEVAAAYYQTEATVQRAMHTPRPQTPTTLLGKVFGVYADPHAYAGLFYMLLTLATGIFYFTWAVTGLALSAGFAILIFGIPFFLLFLASVRLFSLIEGRLIETLLGVRMPRRPSLAQAGTLMERVKAMVTDRRTWSTLIYMGAMMPLGVAYFTAAIVGITLSAGLVAAPFGQLMIDDMDVIHMGNWSPQWPMTLLLVPVGILIFTFTLHLARFIGDMHGRLAKQLLVMSSD